MDTQMNWGADSAETDAPKKHYTVQEFEALCQKLADQRVILAEKEQLAKVEAVKCADLEREILQALENEGLKSYKGKAGTVMKEVRLSVKVPKSDEERRAFFEYLKQRGIFDSMITVNSQTLNAWYKQEFELAKEEGRGLEFQVDGIGEPAYSTTLKFKRST